MGGLLGKRSNYFGGVVRSRHAPMNTSFPGLVLKNAVTSRPRLGGELDRITLNAGEHRPKDDAVKRHHGVPVEQSGQASRLEEGGLAERALRISIGSHAKVQERLA